MRYIWSLIYCSKTNSLVRHNSYLYFWKILSTLNLKSVEAVAIYVTIVDVGRLIL